MSSMRYHFDDITQNLVRTIAVCRPKGSLAETHGWQPETRYESADSNSRYGGSNASLYVGKA